MANRSLVSAYSTFVSLQHETPTYAQWEHNFVFCCLSCSSKRTKRELKWDIVLKTCYLLYKGEELCILAIKYHARMWKNLIAWASCAKLERINTYWSTRTLSNDNKACNKVITGSLDGQLIFWYNVRFSSWCFVYDIFFDENHESIKIHVHTYTLDEWQVIQCWSR